MTHSATRFVDPMTLAGISGEAVAMDMGPGVLRRDARVDRHACRAIVIVPATADFLARLAQGRADDLVTATVLVRGLTARSARDAPAGWSHPATIENVEALARARSCDVDRPRPKVPSASGERGMGRMADPETIVAAIGKHSPRRRAISKA